MPELDRMQVLVAVTKALADDLEDGEPPEALDVPEAATALGAVVCRSRGILAGVPVAKEAFGRVGVRLRPLVGEGATLRVGEPVAEIGGSVRAMLAARATALGFLERLSAVASGCREPSAGDPFEAYAAAFSHALPVSGENGPRFELVLQPEPEVLP
jgi:nicotinate-nucleotide pyrophosphorylase